MARFVLSRDTAHCIRPAIHCIDAITCAVVEYDSDDEQILRRRVACESQASAMGLDRRDLVRRRVVQRDADRLLHARGRYAPQLGKVIHHLASIVVAMGAGDACHNATRSPDSCGAMEKIIALGDPHRRVRCHRLGLRSMGIHDGSVSEPVGCFSRPGPVQNSLAASIQ
jgi:hypothetical protein